MVTTCIPHNFPGTHISVTRGGSSACWAVVVVSPIMRQAHNLELAREIVFMDSTASWDTTKRIVTMVLTATEAALLLRTLRIQLGIRQQQREVLQEVRQLKHKRKHLLQIGGRGLREIGVNAMKAVLAHDVQVLYSLHGRKWKRAFVNLRLCRLVTG
ncbi:uncharacterized protein LOC142784018 [Rhipicephalus microplus]|uniref:uncharacterized protein LOC142784018 n=1 Tax=Rhipicephalus microplus TaxID=6941 RepID=UPI003F6C9011